MKFPKDAVLLAIAYGDRQILKDIVDYTETTITIIFNDFSDFEEFAYSIALPNMWTWADSDPIKPVDKEIEDDFSEGFDDILLNLESWYGNGVGWTYEPRTKVDRMKDSRERRFYSWSTIKRFREAMRHV